MTTFSGDLGNFFTTFFTCDVPVLGDCGFIYLYPNLIMFNVKITNILLQIMLIPATIMQDQQTNQF